MTDWDNISAPPARPFYEEENKPKRRRGGFFLPRKKEQQDKRAAELAAELAKPPAQRTGKLRTIKNGDFTSEEIKKLEHEYANRPEKRRR